ncbi:allergen Cr-PI-like [Thrips palmi]|uniref:Allergen Cr-PI-like n=1 Tax=Thrips palmi TaxID=161013 RepID=A0A6P8Y2V6_THRPL|nr:allergen Cr-PI-like [Thrips palmi]
MYKATIALLAALAVASALQFPTAHNTHPTNNYQTSNVGGQDLALKQKYILQLLRNVSQKNMYPELVALGKTWNPEQYIDRYANQYVVKTFVSMWKQGMLPQGEIFHVYNDSHLKEAVALFDMFYFAKDFDTFIKTAAWARDHVNEGQFVYALSVAAVHRDDCQGVMLPPLYEVYPHLYFHASDMSDFYSAKMQNVYNYVKMTNWTGGYEISQPEQLVGYFTEDAGLNAYYAYAHLYMPFWMNCEKYGITSCQMRGEAFYYFHQQLLAHYNLHRMANYLPEMNDFDWQTPVEYGYHPDLMYHNGAYFPSRPDNQPLASIKSYTIDDLKAIEYRIKEAIDSGFVYGKDGNKIPITQYIKGINMLGNIVEGNQDSVNNRYYGAYTTMLRNLFALIMDPSMEHGVAPGVMAHYETALRDPAFYYYTSYIMDFFKQYKDNLPYYRTEDLYFSGVQVKDVAVDKLITYFDLFDIDVTNAVDFATLDEMTKFNYVAKAMRLNHQPFSYKVNVASDKKTNAVVRVFLGPSTEYIYTNFYGKQASDVYYGHDTADINRLREYFVELDRFPVDLKTGENLIERHSREFTATVGDYDSFKSLLKSAESGNIYSAGPVDHHCGFPDRLALPMGHKAGVPYTLFVMVTPYGVDASEDFHGHSQVNTNTVFSCNGLWTSLDNRPLGFPFDRKIENFAHFYTPNMYFKDVVIFHKDSSDAYSHVAFKKNVNGFDSQYQTVRKYTPSHKLVNEDIYQEDSQIHSFF